MHFNFIYNRISLNIAAKGCMFLCTLLLSASLYAQNDNGEEEKTPDEIALEEADRLERLLDLEPHQTFFIDSTLQHDMQALHDEFMALKLSGTQEYTVYQQIRDKWMARIDSSYRKIMTEYQWLIYRRDAGKLSKEELKTLKAIEKEAKQARKGNKAKE